jgi:hypothetical protein
MKINGALDNSGSELVVLGGAGDRDRTGMTSWKIGTPEQA